MLFDSLFASLENLQTFVVAGAFALARMSALVALLPLFTRVQLTGVLRTGVALVFAIPLMPMMANEITDNEMTTATTIVYLFKEVLVGTTLGLVMGVPFWAAEAAGDIVDLQRGSSMGVLVDPTTMQETSSTGTFLGLVMMMVYVAGGGLELVLDSVYDSYQLWPIDRLMPVFNRDAAEAFLKLLDGILWMALTLMFPLILSLLVTDIVLAFLARASPHLNVFSLSLIVKTLVFSLVFVLYSAFLVSYVGRELAVLGNAKDQMEAIGCRLCP